MPGPRLIWHDGVCEPSAQWAKRAKITRAGMALRFVRSDQPLNDADMTGPDYCTRTAEKLATRLREEIERMSYGDERAADEIARLIAEKLCP